MNWKLAGMAGTALAVATLTTVSATAGANKFTGNVSLGVGETFQGDNLTGFGKAYDSAFTSINGEAKINIAFENNLNLQLDVSGVGSFINDTGFLSLDRDSGFQGTAHGYWRNGNYALGIFGGAGVASGSDLSDAQYYFAGAQGQYYWNNFTVGLDAGYLDSSPSDNSAPDLFLHSAWFADAEARWYATPKLALSADVGYISGKRDFAPPKVDQKTWHWGAKAEYWPEEKEPLSLWVAYEGHTSNFDANPGSDDHTVHTIKVGVTFHFGVDGDQQEQDRQGPAFNQMDYGQIVVGG
jgi:hypothetical protein